jgi:hypothetical protein
MEFDWNPEKNSRLIEKRGVSFEEIICLIEAGHLQAIIRHPKKIHQKIFVIEHEKYAWNVPFVEDETGKCFLKTIYPSRISTKRYLEGKK